MKKILFAVLAVVMVTLLVAPSKMFAGSADTLVVYANGPSLDEVINSDTTSTGTRAHIAYKLVTTDTTYLYLGQVTVNSDITVIGVPGDDGRLPTIQPGILSDGSMPAILFVMTGEGTKGVFKNFYIYGRTVSGDGNWGKDFVLSANDINFYMDNVVVDENRGEVIAYTGTGCSFYVTNSKFRNGVYPSNWYSSVVLVSDYPTTNPADTVIMKYNTFFCINAGAAEPGVNKPTNYLEFAHNSVVYNTTFTLRMFNVAHAVIRDNIFYSTYSCAIPKSQYPFWYESFSYDIGSTISLDTMTVADDSTFNPSDAGKADWRMLTEAKRIVEVKNNVFYLPQEVSDLWTTWNSTHTGADSLYTPAWMNARTLNMFSDKTHWPGFVEEGNQVGVDPQFGSSFANILTNADGESGVGLLNYITLLRGGTISSEEWGYKKQLPTSDYWVPEWPLPELNDMQYTNASIKYATTDGLPMGDPGWFSNGYTGVEENTVNVPTEFTLYDAYPNPFNPSTTIKFNLAQANNISLKVYNTIGQLVKTVVNNEFKSQGEHSVTVNMQNFASGIYFYTLQQGNQQLSKKFVLMK